MLNILITFLSYMGFEYCCFGLDTGIYDTNQTVVASRSCYVQSVVTKFDVLWRDLINLCVLVMIDPMLLEVHK